MSELEIFAAALQIADPLERAAYLDRACGSDQELRRRLGILLQNHADAGSFLERPAIEEPQGPERTERLEQPGPGGEVLESSSPANDTLADSDGNDAQAGFVLAILQPSDRPDALGRLGHYEVLEVLGQGGFGTVVRAFDERLHRLVAIKIMAPHLAVTSPARKRFLREARASAAIRHENVVSTHAIEEQPFPFLVMEYVAGETLQQRLDRTGPLDAAAVLQIGVQLAHGLAAAHEVGQIHRDIKPANILLEAGTLRVKITDFGLARAADDASLSQSGVIAGTPLYMAPEQAQCVALDCRADLFSLGSVLYVMCSGRPPFRAPTTLAVLKRVTEDTPRPIRDIIPEVPDWLCHVISRLHAKRPEDRYQSATEVADLLTRYLAELQQHGKVSPEPECAGRPSGRRWQGAGRRRLLAVAAVFLLALAGLGTTEATGVTRFGTTVARLFSAEGTLGESAAAAELDRRAGAYALSQGGTIFVIEQGAERGLYSGGGVPRGPFDLTVVNLFRNRNVDDAGVDHFKSCRYLRNLDLEGTRVTPGKILELKRALPDCKIDWDGDNRLLPGSPDRRASEFVLSIGGSVNIKGGGLYRSAYSRSALPEGSFDLRWADLGHNQRVRDADLPIFNGCTLLNGLGLGGTNVSDAGLVHVGELKQLAHLRLSQTRVTDAGCARLKDLLSLVGLSLNGTAITDAALANFRYCQGLASLDLGDTRVSDVGLVCLEDRTQLERLILAGTMVTDKGMVRLRDCLKLAHLDLSRTQVGDAGLVHFRSCREVRYLCLSRTKVTDAGLEYFKNCADLALVELNDTSVGDAGLAHLHNCKNLNQLDLAGSRISDLGLARLADFARLYSVDVKHTGVTEAGVRRLAAELPSCKIEWDGGVIEPRAKDDPDRRVAAWLRIPPGGSMCILIDGEETVLNRPYGLPAQPFHLTRLWVRSNSRLSDEVLTCFEGLRHLTHLNIVDCPVTDAMLVHLRGCEQLRELQLPGTGVTDAGMSQLERLSKLEYLNVRQTAVTEAGAKNLAAALPRCTIEWDGGVLKAP